MAHEIFNEPDRETVLKELQDWLACTPISVLDN